MPQRFTAAASLAALLLAGAAAADSTVSQCGPRSPCKVAHSAYAAIPPAGWDGRSRLVPAVWLHGYTQSIAQILQNKELIAAFRASRRLVLIPEGKNGEWGVSGIPGQQPSPKRDDIAFLGAVLDDVARRFPVDPDQATLLGFSLGASMAYEVACHKPALFRHYVAFAGSFWNPLPQRCAEGSIDFLHIHGTGDGVMPLAGRPVGTAHQGNVAKGIEVLRATARCTRSEPVKNTPAGMTCTASTGCSAGNAVTYCLHDGGHDAEPPWVAWALQRSR